MNKNPGMPRGLEAVINTVKGVAPQCIMRFLHAVKADPDGMCRNIQRQGSVGCHRNPQKASACVGNKIMKAIRAVAPQQGFAAFKNNHARTETVQGFQRHNCRIPRHVAVFSTGPQMKRAGAAGQVAPVGNLEACQQGNPVPQKFSFNKEP